MAMKEIFGMKKTTKDGGEKTYWTRIGIAYENKDGSLNCYLDYVPTSKEIVLNIRDPKEKENKGGVQNGSEISDGF